MDSGTVPTPSDDPEVSSDETPESLEITPAADVDMRREIALELENFEGGMQG